MTRGCRVWIGAILFSLAGMAPGWAADREFIVSAAASLTNAFQAVKPAFEAAHPGTRVTLNFAASGALLRQIDQGAPVDVFASADQETMDRAEQQGLLETSTRADFARNVLVLVVPADSRKSIVAAPDLRQEAVDRVAVGDPAYVPAGRYAKQALESVSLWEALQPKVILANSVRQVLDYVSRGEVAAGFVYGTDAKLRSDTVRVIQTMGGHAPILYPVAVVRASTQQDLAGQFVAFLQTPESRAVLAQFGFQAP